MPLIKNNSGFICANCGKQVPPAQKLSRNHCPFCLTSLHVDGPTPGDRLSNCGGLMPTISWEGTFPDNIKLIQKCQTCGHERNNTPAPDDKLEILALKNKPDAQSAKGSK